MRCLSVVFLVAGLCVAVNCLSDACQAELKNFASEAEVRMQSMKDDVQQYFADMEQKGGVPDQVRQSFEEMKQKFADKANAFKSQLDQAISDPNKFMNQIATEIQNNGGVDSQQMSNAANNLKNRFDNFASNFKDKVQSFDWASAMKPKTT